ncbi:MAG: hypothetical protein QOK32_558 [Gaiellaceae bacterium]|jgi:hypothetical protein|nr:hypothetical protein [Gaiellaceae bacterium]
MAAVNERPSRVVQARRRAQSAKAALACLGVVLFAASAALARATSAGHPKHRARSLSAPKQFVQIVRENQLQAGALAPPTAPPEAATSQS